MRWLALGLSSIVALSACGDDSAGGSGTDTDGTTGTTGDDTGMGETAVVDETGVDTAEDADGSSGDPTTGEPTECTVDADCDDGDPCTVDDCSGSVCEVSGAVQSAECRPQIDVDFPPRAATLDGEQDIEITGTVSTGAGDIVSLQINGEEVDVATDGSFSHPYSAQMGGNTLVIEAEDSYDVTRRRVQSFLWSPNYRLPTTPDNGIADQGLALYLDQESLDDGDHVPPPDDIATVLNLLLAEIDVAQYVDESTPIATFPTAGYEVFLTSIAYDSTDVSLSSIDGGIHLQGSLLDITGDLVLDCVSPTCLFVDATGDVAVDSITVDSDLMITVDGSNQLVVTPTNTDTMINNLVITTGNPATDFLIALIQPFVIGGVLADIENELTTQVDTLLGPALSQAFNSLTPATTLTFPNLADDTTPIDVELVTDFQATDFHDGSAPPNPSPPAGGVIWLRGGAYAANVVAPYDNLGIPDRFGCGTGDAIDVARNAPLEIGLTDDLLNQLLFAAWRGGLLEFALPAEALDGGGVVEDLEVAVSGMLAPTASDCGPDGEVRIHLGDVRIDATMTVGGNPVSFVAYSSMLANLEVTPTGSGAEITISDLESIETELTVDQDEQIDQEFAFTQLLEGQLEGVVISSLSEAGLGAIELPEIDISSAAGLPPGTVALSITTDSTVRVPGITVIQGHL